MKQQKNQKRIIGLIGRPGVGKDTVVSIIQKMSRVKVEKFSFSQILIDEYCTHLSIEPTHPNLQYIGDAIRPSWLHERAKKFIEESDADIIIIPSIRRAADFDFVQSFPHHLLVGIVTDEKEAYERMKARKEKPGEEFLTWEAYQALLAGSIDKEIPSLLNRAEKILENNGTLEEFEKKIQELVS